MRIRGDGPGNSRRKRKRNRQPVRHSNDDVANRFRRGEVVFRMGRGGHSVSPAIKNSFNDEYLVKVSSRKSVTRPARAGYAFAIQ